MFGSKKLQLVGFFAVLLLFSLLLATTTPSFLSFLYLHLIGFSFNKLGFMLTVNEGFLHSAHQSP